MVVVPPSPILKKKKSFPSKTEAKQPIWAGLGGHHELWGSPSAPWPLFLTNPAQVQSKVIFLSLYIYDGPDFQDFRGTMTIYFDQPRTGTVESRFFGIKKKGRSRFSRFQGHHDHLFWPTLHRYSRKSLFWHPKKREVPIFKMSRAPWAFKVTNAAQGAVKTSFVA